MLVGVSGGGTGVLVGIGAVGGTGVSVGGTGVLVLVAVGGGCSDEGPSPPQARRAKRAKKATKMRSRFMARILIGRIVQFGSLIPSQGHQAGR